jgi:hypothetical protein
VLLLAEQRDTAEVVLWSADGRLRVAQVVLERVPCQPAAAKDESAGVELALELLLEQAFGKPIVLEQVQ